MSIHDHHHNHSANQGQRCRTESTHSAEVSGAQPGQHSRVLVSSLNTVEDVPSDLIIPLLDIHIEKYYRCAHEDIYTYIQLGPAKN